MQTNNETKSPSKGRHNLVTIWLILMIIGNALTALKLLFSAFIHNRYPEIPMPMQIITAFLTIVSVFFVVQILRWKMIGFTGYVATVAIVLITALLIGNLSLIRVIYAIAGIAILYSVLQIKKNGKSAWKELE